MKRLMKDSGMPSSSAGTSAARASVGNVVKKNPKAGERSLEQVRAAKGSAQRTFAAVGKVVGVGITRIAGGYGLKVNLESEPEARTVLPGTIKGIPVRVEVVGALKRRVARK